eukprot:TRINITY_DN17840_c0_g1_i1.p1 TRINITY_DN17840_c0_g1~~TRINITY_DN17840_c0_g1_i1.p1  ORF type:complete len:304 (+),score=49.53 TRINITY_DN17840_c0_g1_i1:23-934(+)
MNTSLNHTRVALGSLPIGSKVNLKETDETGQSKMDHLRSRRKFASKAIEKGSARYEHFERISSKHLKDLEHNTLLFEKPLDEQTSSHLPPKLKQAIRQAEIRYVSEPKKEMESKWVLTPAVEKRVVPSKLLGDGSPQNKVERFVENFRKQVEISRQLIRNLEVKQEKELPNVAEHTALPLTSKAVRPNYVQRKLGKGRLREISKVGISSEFVPKDNRKKIVPTTESFEKREEFHFVKDLNKKLIEKQSKLRVAREIENSKEDFINRTGKTFFEPRRYEKADVNLTTSNDNPCLLYTSPSPRDS